jgi:hypothetical protein
MAADSVSVNNDTTYAPQPRLQVGGGVALLVPLGGTGYKNSCSGLLQLQMNRAKLALAKQLLDDGLITDEEMKKTVASMHRSLGIR